MWSIIFEGKSEFRLLLQTAKGLVSWDIYTTAYIYIYIYIAGFGKVKWNLNYILVTL
jgi:hypothetical protein